MIIGLSGAIGAGKSHCQVKAAIDMANLKEKQLVFNFPVNVRAIYEYAKIKRFKWIQNLCLKGCIIQIPNPNNIAALLIPQAVVVLDEAGIFLNSRDFANTPKELLNGLAMSRKGGTDLIWAAQFNEQVDKQFRLLTQYWIHCNGLATYDKKLKGPRLIWKRCYWFDAPSYNFWMSDVKAYSSHFKTRFSYAFKYEGGLLNRADYMAFNIFDSFARLDGSDPSVIRTLQRCELPAGYFYGAGDVDLVPSPALPPPEIVLPNNRKSLIGSALNHCREKGIKPPYFKSMTDSQIAAFISSRSLP